MEQLQQQLASSADTGGACLWAPVSYLLTWKLAALHDHMPAAFDKSSLPLVQVFQGTRWNMSWRGEPAMHSARPMLPELMCRALDAWLVCASSLGLACLQMLVPLPAKLYLTI